jgi:hypothetical protein
MTYVTLCLVAAFLALRRALALIGLAFLVIGL